MKPIGLRRLIVALLTVVSLGMGGAAAAQDAAGDWKGVLTPASGVTLRIAIHLKPAAGGGYQGTLDAPDQSVYDRPIVAATQDGRLSFAYAAADARYAATWDAAAHAWNGVWTQHGHDLPLVLSAGAYPAAASIAGLDGEWDGTLDMGTGLRLRLAFHFNTGPHGTIATFDSVDQGAYGASVSALSRDGDHVQLEMKPVGAIFAATLAGQGQTLTGAFTQNGLALPLTLKRLAPGQTSPWTKPSAAASDAAAPAGDWKIPSDADIRQLLADRIDKEHQGVGAVVGVVDASGRRVIVYGRSDSANGRPLDGDTEFEIGSITKVFTSLVLTDMAAKGELKLDDPIAGYLPPGVTAPSKDGKQITLTDLATHTSGLPRLPTNLAPKDMADPYADYSMDQLWQFLSGYQLTRDPGAQWEYSNLGFGLLGDLLARRAGTDYETLVKARVIGPLHMTSTTITLTRDEQARLAVGHDSSLREVANWDLPTLAGAGALRSTANDLMTFVATAMGLSPSPLSADFTATLAVTRPGPSPSFSQALGWEVIHTAGGEVIQHGGGTGGYHTLIAYSPKTRVGVVMLTNAETINGGDDIAMHILTGSPVRALLPPPPAPPERHAVSLDAKALDALAGRYALAPQVTLTVTRDGEHLMAQLTGQSAYEVFPESPTEVFWKVVDAQATFRLGPDGRAESLTLHQNGRDLPAPRIP